MIEARIPGTEGDMAGYAVVHVTGQGERECRLVTSLHSLDAIRIDEERRLTGLLFDLVVPPSGDTGYVNASRPLLLPL